MLRFAVWTEVSAPTVQKKDGVDIEESMLNDDKDDSITAMDFFSVEGCPSFTSVRNPFRTRLH